MDDLPAVPAPVHPPCVGCGGSWPRLAKQVAPLLAETGAIKTMSSEGIAIRSHLPGENLVHDQESGFIPRGPVIGFSVSSEKSSEQQEIDILRVERDTFRTICLELEKKLAAIPAPIPTMTGAELIAFHKEACDKMHALCIKKNADYAGAAGGADAFANFRMVESFGVVSTEAGMFTRMCDKFSRIATFIKVGILQVKDESIEDTLLDGANYLIIMAAWFRAKRKAHPTK